MFVPTPDLYFDTFMYLLTARSAALCLVAVSGGYALVVVRGLLTAVASPVVEHRL